MHFTRSLNAIIHTLSVEGLHCRPQLDAVKLICTGWQNSSSQTGVHCGPYCSRAAPNSLPSPAVSLQGSLGRARLLSHVGSPTEGRRVLEGRGIASPRACATGLLPMCFARPVRPSCQHCSSVFANCAPQNSTACCWPNENACALLSASEGTKGAQTRHTQDALRPTPACSPRSLL